MWTHWVSKWRVTRTITEQDIIGARKCCWELAVSTQFQSGEENTQDTPWKSLTLCPGSPISTTNGRVSIPNSNRWSIISNSQEKCPRTVDQTLLLHPLEFEPIPSPKTRLGFVVLNPALHPSAPISARASEAALDRGPKRLVWCGATFLFSVRACVCFSGFFVLFRAFLVLLSVFPLLKQL